MSLRSKYAIYLIVLHLVLMALAFDLYRSNKYWIVAIELGLMISLVVGFRLSRSIFGVFELVRSGAQFIEEGDFTSRFRKIGQPETDRLISIYNTMIDNLREERLRAQEQHHFLDKILRVSPAAVITFDFDDRVASVNPSAERIFQMRAQEMLGKSLTELECGLARRLMTVSVGEPRVLPLRGGRRVKCQKLEFLDRGFARHFLLIDELTEELRQSEKAAYEKLIRMMSHEVNNSVGAANSLLHSCLNYSDQLDEEDRKDYETALRAIIERTAQLSQFMRGLAEMARIPSPNLSPCDPVAMLRDVEALMRVESERRRVSWVWDIVDIGSVAMDRIQMEQVFVNIVKNALEAIGADGTITIRASLRAGQRVIVIEDSGAGIDPEVSSHLFSPFYSTKKNGQGVGLTLIKEILKNHNFEFSLESLPPTQFTIYLPG